jgi:hypothetical protein
MNDPKRKNVNAVISNGLRPKTSLSLAKSGREQVAAMRDEMPSQNELSVEPCKTVAMVYRAISTVHKSPHS